MRRLLSSILIICTLLLSGCGNAPKIDNENIKLTQNEVITENDDSWKAEVAQRLYEEFCYFYDNMEEHVIIEKAMHTHKYVNRNKVGYNCVMANDRGCGISQVYYKYLSYEQIEDVRNKMFALDCVDYFSGVQFGYSESGLHFIVIYPQDTEYGTVSSDAVNKIRSYNNEFNFISAFSDCLPVDLYVEDLSENTNKVNIKISFGDKSPTNSISDYSAEILKRYDKSYKFDEALKPNSWNLYMFESTSDDNIIISTDNETITLYNGIPVANIF